MVKLLPLCWAFPVAADHVPSVFEWFAQMKTDYWVERFQQYQQKIKQHRYQAWLQSSPQGYFIVEHSLGENPDTAIVENLTNNPDEFTEWCVAWKEKIHADGFKKWPQLRYLAEVTVNLGKQSQLLLPTTAYAFPLAAEKLGEAIVLLDDWQRNLSQPLQAYFQQLGLEYWRAWIETVADKHYFLQSYQYPVDTDLNTIKPPFLQSNDFHEQIFKLFHDCLNIDINKHQQWPLLEPLIHFEKGQLLL